MSSHDRARRDRWDLIAVARRRGWVVVLAALVVVLAALVGSTVQAPVYQARARVLAEVPSVLSTATNGPSPASSTETEAEVVASEGVQTLVRQRLGETPPIEAVPVGDSHVMDVVAESSRRTQAAAVANAYAQAYVDHRRQQTADRLLTATREVGAKVDELSKQIDGLGTNDPRRSTLLSQLGVFRAQLDQLQVDAALIGGGPQVLVRAVDPDGPIRPRTGRNVAVAGAAGLAFGLLLVLLFERLDRSVRTRSDLARAAPGVRLLGVVPAAVSRGGGDEVLVIRTEPNSPAAEAYRSVRTQLRGLATERPLRTLLVTSPGPGEGRTTTVANLATALARAGQEVVALSCDLRSPRLHHFFGLPNQVGFTSVVLGEAPLSAALRKVPGEERLRLLPSGPIPPNPSELLSSQRAAEVVAALAAQADWVVVDSPALTVADASVLAQQVDAVLLVVCAGSTTASQLSEAVTLLEPARGAVVGAVMHGCGPAGVRPRHRRAEARGPDDRSRQSNGSGRAQQQPSAAPQRPPLRPGAGVRESS